MPIPVVFGIGVCASRQQRARDCHQPGRPLRSLVAQARVADIKERFPILDPSCLSREFGMLLQTARDRFGVTEHEFGVQAGVGDGGISREQPKRAFLRVPGSAANEFVNGHGERQRLFLDTLV
jgi:hypothetical protein